MNKPHEQRDRLAVRCFNNLPPEIAEPRIIGFRFGFDAATEIHQKQIERLREALRFYSKRESWAEFISYGNIFNEQDGDF